MPKLARLSNVKVEALSLVKAGANRNVYFLRKSDGTIEALPATAAGPLGMLEAPFIEGVIAKSDWSVVYCVVASPGAAEGPGMLAKADDPDDMWESEDEIRKAAHGFMKNGALVNRMHEDLEPFGDIVENAIAHADFAVDGHTILKGSWYVAIEPTAEGRDLIEKGEFTGVSLQGTGTRTIVDLDEFGVEVAKASSKAPAAQGTKGKDREGKGSSQVCPSCGGKVKVGAKTCPNCGTKLSGGTGKSKLAKALESIGKALGIEVDLEEDEIEKAGATFAQRIAAQEVDEELPGAVDCLRSCIYDAVWPFAYGYADAPAPADARAALDTSLEEFHAYMLGVFDRVAGGTEIAKSEELRDELRTLVKNLPSGMTTHTEDDDEMADKSRLDEQDDAIAAIKKSVDDLVTGLEPVIAKVKEANEPAPTVEDVQKSLGDVTEMLAKLGEKVEALGAGDSTQTTTVAKSKSTDPLSGLLD